jgi:hypothetical protein
VTRRQLLEAGITGNEIDHRLGTGALIRQHPGVYRVGHAAPCTEATYIAAVKACGEDAVLSGRAAAHLMRLLKSEPPPPEVTCPTERRIEGVGTRRVRNLDPRDRSTFRGIPVTSIARTLVDLAAVLDGEQLARACHEAGVLHGTTPRMVDAALARYPNAPGSAKLGAVLRGDVKVSLSKLEKGFVELLRTARLPLPETNRPAGGRRVDCRWPRERLTVELDSYAYHNSRYSWVQDRRREREARARGDEFRRFSWEDVFVHRRLTTAELRRLLGGHPG